MAALTDSQKRLIRNQAERKALALGIPVRWAKNAIHDAAQTIVDTLDGDSPILAAEVGVSKGLHIIVSQRIDAATNPHGLSFTGAEKKWLFAFVVEQIYERDK